MTLGVECAFCSYKSLINRGRVIVAAISLIGSLSLCGCGKAAISSVSMVPMPDALDSPEGKGFTCTGLARDEYSGGGGSLVTSVKMCPRIKRACVRP